MEEISSEARKLLKELELQVAKLDFISIDKQIDDLKLKQQEPDFWKDNQAAQKSMQLRSKLQRKVDPWRDLTSQLSDIIELSELNDDSVKTDLYNQLQSVEAKFEQLKKDLMYNGKYDDYDVILNIYSGAGGTDAQDWAQMLERMYIRWAEREDGVFVKVISESAGEEAGIKSATLEIAGPLVYGKLQSEHGVHRLVRLSPFNADNLRQTSFAKVDILPKIDKPEDAKIDQKDLKIDVYRAGGHGGQSVNTTDSAVRITHMPTGISVAIQNERSQIQNKETALSVLSSRLVQLQLEQHKEAIADLKGPNEQAAWGNQIRNYVMHPYSMVKDARTKQETTDVKAVLDGNINDFITAYADSNLGT